MAWENLEEELDELFSEIDTAGTNFNEFVPVSIYKWSWLDRKDAEEFAKLEQQILAKQALLAKASQRREIVRKAVRKYRSKQRADSERYAKLRTVANAAKARRNKKARLEKLQAGCLHCGAALPDCGKGRVRKFCSKRCLDCYKMRVWRKKQAEKRKLKRSKRKSK